MQKNKTQILTEMMEGINEMIGAAGVMMHHQQDMRWYFIRKILEEVKTRAEKTIINPMTAPVHKPYEKKTQILLP